MQCISLFGFSRVRCGGCLGISVRPTTFENEHFLVGIMLSSYLQVSC